MRIKQAFAVAALAMTPALTGCLVHTHSVMKTRLPDTVQNATLDQLLQQVDQRYKTTQTATLVVGMSASTGGSLQGKVTDSFSFSGYIVLQNPDHIEVILKVPVFGRVLDMVSDGKDFKMLVPPKSCAIVGSDTAPAAPASAGQDASLQTRLYRLRPGVLLDPLLIRGLGPGQDVSMTQDSRVFENPKKRKDIIQEPDYDIEVLSQPQGQVAHILRVIHIGRIDLLPYEQDIYNAEGKIETQAIYSNYRKFGDINFPTKIVIQRPLDALGLTITVDDKKTNFNQPLDADTFDLGPIPSSYTVQNMDDPASAATNPCAPHGAQSPH
jgi:hypothetical protein